jgi:hypothetical protein
VRDRNAYPEDAMQKLRLSLDDLAVTTFTPRTQDAAAAGTVQAHDALVFGPTNGNTCRTCETNCLPYC